MTKKIFAFCLAAIASFALLTNAANADDAKKTKDVKVSSTTPAEVTADDAVDAPVVLCDRRHFRRLPKLRLPKLRLPKFDFPEIKFPKIKFPRLKCALATPEVIEVADVDESDTNYRVICERKISFAGKVKQISYVKIPGRFLPKRIVTTSPDGVDVEP
ncbi:MAG: hypothetical protein LBP59_07635 [Planctomycetaceae bacterium]|nr:hypothetical protein [Planctomycetaceae bacterium]